VRRRPRPETPGWRRWPHRRRRGRRREARPWPRRCARGRAATGGGVGTPSVPVRVGACRCTLVALDRLLVVAVGGEQVSQVGVRPDPLVGTPGSSAAGHAHAARYDARPHPPAASSSQREEPRVRRLASAPVERSAPLQDVAGRQRELQERVVLLHSVRPAPGSATSPPRATARPGAAGRPGRLPCAGSRGSRSAGASACAIAAQAGRGRPTGRTPPHCGATTRPARESRGRGRDPARTGQMTRPVPRSACVGRRRFSIRRAPRRW
jgi:hypothetical protein